MAMKPRHRRGRPQSQRGWTIPRPSPTTDPRRRPRPSSPVHPIESRPRTAPGPRLPTPTLDTILDDFTRSWERGERPRAEGYLGLLTLEDSAELIYHEFCLAEAADLEPDPADYLLRFPEQASSLSRLFALHGVFSSSTLREWTGLAGLPSSGDEIGPYQLLRELGRGAFARVFLAEQSDLDDRLVVLKVSTRATAEPRLLARASHVHIVEVLRHAVADDGALHLVCMPFLGGATLASVLEERRRLGRRPRSGLDLLGDLDRVSAPEYPSTEMVGPTREVLAGLSHAQAMAWIVARLAEALDHAHQRGVEHGDLKPSNILLTAGANPLLLDFNLSVDWRDAGPDDPAIELGGTLAYMAPERLEAIAEGGRDRPPKAADLHRADLYALGLLLLEALTGQVPEVPRRRTRSPRELVGTLARLRRNLPDSLGSGSDRSIPPALRSILSRCLAPDPIDRYARGNELAEDLDRWRSDRPLAFAEESRSSDLSRKVRLRRAPLIALGLTMAVALIATSLASIVLQGTQRDQALAKYLTIIDRADSGVFGFRQGQWRGDEMGDPVELASHQLARYDVLTDPNWRARDDIRALPDREHDDLEAWLFEQILRYARALGDAPESPESWKRGLALLDRTLDQIQSEPLQAQRLLLLERLKQPDRHRNDREVPRLPRWMDAYLAGVAAEPLHAREAMGLYLEALKDRPELFWGHYRTALVACRINEYDEASRHLRICSGRSPGNPALHAQLASVLYFASRDMLDGFKHDPLGEALLECDRSVRLDPDFAPAYRIRAMILRATRQSESFEADVDRFAAISRRTGPASALNLRLRLMFSSGSNSQPLSDAGQSVARQILQANPDDRDTRTKLAAVLARDGRTLEAIGEYDRVLEGDPDRLEARYRRAEQLFKLDRPLAIEEFTRLIDHPRFEEIFSFLPSSLLAYHYVAINLMERGKIAEALEVAERSLVHIRRSRALSEKTLLSRDKFMKQEAFAPNGRTLYLLAQIRLAASKTQGIAPDNQREHHAKAIEYLGQAFAIHPKFRTVWFANDHVFEDLRDEVDSQFGVSEPVL
jgi:eukaryotic-like serine/threonine-protein kinase